MSVLLRRRRAVEDPPDVAGDIVQARKVRAEDILDEALSDLENAVAMVRRAVETTLPKPPGDN